MRSRSSNSTTHGIGLVAEGFPWNAGDSVVTAAEEYPSNLYPWMNLESRGVGLRLVPTRAGRVWIDDLIAAVDHSTRMITISHVEFSSGFRNDLDAIGAFCRERGIAFFVDAIQGLGPLEIDVARTPIDFMAADGHKWLLGPEGAGILYVRREWIERLRPIGVGWRSVVGSYNPPAAEFRLKPGADRWEGGTLNMAGLLALGASVGLILEIGPAAVSRRGTRAGRGRARSRSRGRLDDPWLGSPPKTDRRLSCSNGRASIPTKRRATCDLKASSSRAAGDGCVSAPTSTTTKPISSVSSAGSVAAPGSSRHFIS